MGRRGARPLPTCIKEARGTLRKHRENPEEPQLPPLEHDPPKDLEGRARDEWVRLMAGEWGKQVPRDADLTVFGVYCKIVGDEDMLTKEMAALGMELAIAKGIAGKLDQTRQRVKQYAAELGLTPAARSGVKGTQKKEPGRLEQFMRKPLARVK
jgi:phage terminase small subunit